MKIEHTPELWFVGTSADYFPSGATVIRTEKKVVIAVITKTPEEAANACLIAAAPEMLVLLADWPINMSAEKWNDWHEKRRALLAKIEGKEANEVTAWLREN